MSWAPLGRSAAGFISTLLGFGDISGFSLRTLSLAVGGGVLVLFIMPIEGHQVRAEGRSVLVLVSD